MKIRFEDFGDVKIFCQTKHFVYASVLSQGETKHDAIVLGLAELEEAKTALLAEQKAETRRERRRDRTAAKRRRK